MTRPPLDSWPEIVAGLEEDKQELRDQIEQLRATIETMDMDRGLLRGEVETMNAVHKQTAHQLADCGREIERLRTALHTVQESGALKYYADTSEIVRAALERT